MDPFIGEIRMFAGNYAPYGWAFCNGAQLSTSQNDTLYSLIGTTYGGDGSSYYNLPDLQCRLPVHQGTNPATGTNYPLGQKGGVETVTLTPNQLPSHTHSIQAGGAGSVNTPKGAYLADSPGSTAYYSPPGNGTVAMSPITTIPDGGSGQAHNNIQPFLCYTFIIALEGIYPTRP